MGHKWVGVTERMDVKVTSGSQRHQWQGTEMVIFYKDIEADKERGLFLVNSDDICSLNKKACVHVRIEHDRRYAYLLKQPSGNLKHLIDESEWRLSSPMDCPLNGSLSITKVVLEHKVRAPEWE